VSEENVEVAHAAVAAFNRGAYEVALEYFDPEVELIAPPEFFWGHAGIRNVVADWNAQFDDYRVGRPRIIDAHESGVVVLLTLRGRIKGTGGELRQPIGIHWEFHAGKVRRWHAYSSWEEALKAVGLSE
jgi:ketosteroid isomerase-like protein